MIVVSSSGQTINPHPQITELKGITLMAHKNRVLKSINNEDESRCVDIFVRQDETCGFEEFRRDIEDNQGWFAIGFHENRVFDSEKEALAEALKRVGWLKEIMAGR